MSKPLHEKVKVALHEFFRNDCDLLERNVNERSITHKLAEHLQHQFKSLKVDCEYNRHEEDIKALPIEGYTQTNCLDARTVFPDIIVHRRGDDSCNRLVIEVKKYRRNVETDKKKLCAFTNPTNPKHKYNYALGLLLVFDVDNRKIRYAKCFWRGKMVQQCALCKDLQGVAGIDHE